jgi:CheY-like chemotaxis protein
MKNIPSNNPLTRALIIEDSEINAMAVQSMLKHLNCQAEIAECGTVALTKIDNPFHFIIMDLGLPDADGLELSRTIRQQSACNASTPIVILTAHGDKKQKEQAREMGLNGFLFKPLTEELCQEMINRFVLTALDKNYFIEN